MSTIKPGDVMLTKSCRMVRVLASRDDGAVAMRDYRSRVAVRSVDTDRLSYHSEHELTLVQPPATPQEPDTYGPFFDPCDKCVTRTHCAHHDRCLAECVPADLRTSEESIVEAADATLSQLFDLSGRLATLRAERDRLKAAAQAVLDNGTCADPDCCKAAIKHEAALVELRAALSGEGTKP